MKKAILVPRCILTRGLDWKSNGSYHELAEIMKVIIDSKSGIIQLPCPHLESMIQNEEDSCAHSIHANTFAESNLNNSYVQLYTRMISPVIKEIEACEKQGVRITGLIGVKGSPCCSTKTSKDDIDRQFMKLLLRKMEERLIHIETANI
ncbi:MAG: hypothetical protein JKX79_13125 [Labilibaculum sp.]|nr:hypothetical protein [Labilibaculum sp.]